MPASPEERQIHVLPFSHLDLFWLGNRHECVSRGHRVIDEAVRLCEEHEEFRFLIEDAVFLNRYVASAPAANAERLRSLMAAGQIEGPAKWAGVMATNIMGETMVRNTMYGLRETVEFCGRHPAALHLGDLPGLPARLPQFAAGCGLKYAVISRGGPKQTPLFRWVADDGSSVLTWYTPKCYNWGMGLANPPAEFTDAVRDKLLSEAGEIFAVRPGPILMHAGWDLSVPTDHLLPNLERMNRTGINTRFSTQEEYFAAAESSDRIPELTGELPTVWGNWPDSAYLDVTSHHGPAERSLLWAEWLSAFAHALRPGARSSLEDSWKALLESLDHNYSLVATEETHDEKVRLAESARIRADDLSHLRMQRIASEAQRPDGSIPITVFNSSLRSETAVVRQRVLLYGDIIANARAGRHRLAIRTDSGTGIPVQVMRHRHCGAQEYDIAFVAGDVSPCGFSTYFAYAVEGEAEAPQAPRAITDLVRLQSGSTCMEVSPDSGLLSLLREDGQPLLDSLRLRAVEQDPANNVMQLRATGETAGFTVETAQVVNEGPVLTVVRLAGSIDDTPAELTVEASPLCEHLVVRVALTHDGCGFKRYQLVGDLPGGRADAGFVGTPFGANALENVLPGCGPSLGDEVLPETWPSLREAQGWFLLHPRAHGNSVGLAVATERKLIELSDDGFAINLLSCMSAKWIRGETVHHPFAGRYESSFAFRVVAARDIAAAAALGDAHFMGMRSFCDYGGGTGSQITPSASSIVSCDSPNISITALKPAEDGDGIIARFRETARRDTTVKLDIAADTDGAWSCDLLENNVEQVDLSAVRFRPNELKTIRWRLAGGPASAGA